jgi:hypothetical protein
MLFRSFAGAAGHCGEFHFDQAEVPPIQPFRAQLLEKRTIRVVKDHTEADHADAQSRRPLTWYIHALMIVTAG